MKRAAVCLLLLLGCQHHPAPAVSARAAPEAGAPSESDQSPTERLAGHPWWKGEVQPADVERVVDAVRAQGRGVLVLVDRRCRITVLRARQEVARFRADRRAGGKDLPDRVYFDLDDYPTRPAWAQVLRDLKGSLDRSDLLPPGAP
jgi:hypothetical protein